MIISISPSWFCFTPYPDIIIFTNNIYFGMKNNISVNSEFYKLDGTLNDKLDYHPCEVYDITARAYEREDLIHSVNEPVMRSYFTKLLSCGSFETAMV